MCRDDAPLWELRFSYIMTGISTIHSSVQSITNMSDLLQHVNGDKRTKAQYTPRIALFPRVRKAAGENAI